jgi:hypothetical protein
MGKGWVKGDLDRKKEELNKRPLLLSRFARLIKASLQYIV